MNGKSLLLTAALMLSVAATASAQRLASQLPEGAEAKIRQALFAPTLWWFDETPLSEVVDTINQQHAIEIALDIRALEEIGLDADTPVTIHARGISLESGLNRVLRSIEATLTWTIDNETLLITTDDAEYELLQVVIYDVHHLIDSEGDYYGDYDALIELITRLIAPDSWDEVGGPASISEYEAPGIRAVIISQTFIVHRSIDRLLRKLHQLGGHPMPIARPLRNDEHQTTLHGGRTNRLPFGTSIWNPRNLPMTKERRTKPTHRVQEAWRTVAAPDWARSSVYDASR